MLLPPPKSKQPAPPPPPPPPPPPSARSVPLPPNRGPPIEEVMASSSQRTGQTAAAENDYGLNAWDRIAGDDPYVLGNRREAAAAEGHPGGLTCRRPLRVRLLLVRSH